jgi:hypothetical protein
MRLTPEAVARARDALAEAAAMGSLFLGTLQSPWITATLTDGHAAQAAIDLARELADERVGAIKELIARVLAPVRPLPPSDTAELISLLHLAERVNQHLVTFNEAIFATDLADLHDALRPADSGPVTRALMTLISGRYRRAKATVQGNAKSQLSAASMRGGIKQSRDLLEQWRTARFAADKPIAVSGAADFLRVVNAFAQQLQQLGAAIHRSDLLQIPLPELETLLAALRDDAPTARRIPGLRQVEKKLNDLGLSGLVSELRKTNPPGEHWPAMFEQAWLVSCIEHVWAEEPELASFNGRVHDKFAAEFCDLDRQRLEVAAAQVRAATCRKQRRPCLSCASRRRASGARRRRRCVTSRSVS